jgi:AraC-like DNA-binding protein
MSRTMGAPPATDLDKIIDLTTIARALLLHMHVTAFAPSPSLAPYVRRFTVVEAEEEATRVLLPETGIVLGLRYRGAAELLRDGQATRLGGAVITGVGCAVRHMRTLPASGIIVTLFHEAGAAAFFPEPLGPLFGVTRPCETLASPAMIARVQARLAASTSAAARVAIVEGFLLTRLRPCTPDPLVVEAARVIGASRGAIRIRQLAEALGVSQDPLEKRFRRVVGASPKQLASIVRLRRIIEDYRPGVNLGRLAQEAGYCDQSHFNRDFRTFTGASPSQFLRAGAYC